MEQSSFLHNWISETINLNHSISFALLALWQGQDVKDYVTVESIDPCAFYAPCWTEAA